MSARDSVTSAPAKKSSRDRNNPTPDKERVRAYQARRRETHKEIKVFIPVPVKQALMKLCEAEGKTQAEVLEELIQEAATRKGIV